jgi:hypothetical protein
MLRPSLPGPKHRRGAVLFQRILVLVISSRQILFLIRHP